MRILITGGTGFVGTYLTTRLIEDGNEVTILTRSDKAPKAPSPGISYLRGDPTQQGLWQECGPCLIKGNVDRLDKRWYHLPGFRHYESTEVNLEHGDRWFCSEGEAQEAGFERARE